MWNGLWLFLCRLVWVICIIWGSWGALCVRRGCPTCNIFIFVANKGDIFLCEVVMGTFGDGGWQVHNVLVHGVFGSGVHSG